ncbi:MAG TPA: PAS domain-containing sensor histidine kinase [Bacteroidia bacterium]|jgi:PAS domain S-box-containing protein|nr:PAS domain-containing sensor histidine kinase [Bacteroidia bacterium]
MKKKTSDNSVRTGIFASTDSQRISMKQKIEMLQSLFEFATEGIIICDDKGVIVLVNPATEKIFGYSRAALEGNRIEMLLPSRYHSKHVHNREGYMQNPHPRSMGKGMDLYGMRKDGSEIMVEVSLSPFETAEGKYVMSFIVDSTERKKNEIELRLAHDRLQQTSDALAQLNAELESKVHDRTEELADAIRRLAESKREVMRALEKEKLLNELKSRFVTTASHEFRTPLATILSSISLIDRYSDPEHTEKRKKHVERVKTSVTNLTEILNDFLSVEKLEEGIVRFNPVDVDLMQLVTEVMNEMRVTAKKGQRLIESMEGDAMVYLDRQLLKNSLINLISNAVKYSDEEKEINVNVKNSPKKLVIEVKDYGIGIPVEDQANIFERFYRAGNSANIQGTGLGLNIVKKYIDLMDGTIGFISEQNKGTIFTIEIPALKNNKK